MVQPLWKIVPQNVKQLPYDSAISYPRGIKTYVHPNTCTQIFIAVLLIIAKRLIIAIN